MNARPALEIARWEFKRFFKFKDVALSLGIVASSGLLGRAVFEFVQREDHAPLRIAVTSPELLPAPSDAFGPRFVLVPADGTRPELERALFEEEYDGLLVLRTPDEGELVVREKPGWSPELAQTLTELRRSARIAERGLGEGELAGLLAPFAIDVHLTSGERGVVDRASRISAFVVVGMMLLGIFLGNSYLFVSITGEKTQRVTEQLMSIMPPQAWIDGKILGLSLLVLTQVLSYVAGYMVFVLLSVPLFDAPIRLPHALGHVGVLTMILLLSVLGFFFWFAFFAAFASSINDPNSSSRSSLIMLPMIPLAPAFFAVGSASDLWVRILSVLPISSSSFMAARLAVGNVHPVELGGAVALLVASALAMRRAAGKIFGLAMLMYGKEPSLREMVRWIRSV